MGNKNITSDVAGVPGPAALKIQDLATGHSSGKAQSAMPYRQWGNGQEDDRAFRLYVSSPGLDVKGHAQPYAYPDTESASTLGDQT